MTISTLKKLLNEHPDYTLKGGHKEQYYIHKTNADCGLAIGIYGPMMMAVRVALKLAYTSNKVVDEIVLEMPFSKWYDENAPKYSGND